MDQPHSREAEEAYLGSVLIDPDVLADSSLSPADFYVIRNQWVYAACRKLEAAGSAVDYMTVCDQLERDGHLAEAGGPAYLTGLLASTPTSTNAEHYAAIIKDYAAKRTILALMNKGAGWAMNGKNASETLVFLERELSRISVATGAHLHTITDAEDAARLMMQAVDRAVAGDIPAISTGLIDLDQLLVGLFPQDLTIVAGRPGEGKTALLLTILVNTAIKAAKKRVALFSLEMSVTQITMRIISQLTGIPVHRIRSGRIQDEEWPAYTHAIDQVCGAKIYFDDTPALSLTQLRQKMRRLAELGVDLVLIDQLSNITPETRGEKTHEALNAIAYGVKNMAREFNVPVVIAHQMNRLVEHQTEPDPTLKDLADAGEKAADNVIFIVNKKQNDIITNSRLKIAKQRNGPIGSVAVQYLPNRTRFENAEKGQQQVTSPAPLPRRATKLNPADYELPDEELEL